MFWRRWALYFFHPWFNDSWLWHLLGMHNYCIPNFLCLNIISSFAARKIISLRLSTLSGILRFIITLSSLRYRIFFILVHFPSNHMSLVKGRIIILLIVIINSLMLIWLMFNVLLPLSDLPIFISVTIPWTIIQSILTLSWILPSFWTLYILTSWWWRIVIWIFRSTSLPQILVRYQVFFVFFLGNRSIVTRYHIIVIIIILCNHSLWHIYSSTCVLTSCLMHIY